MASKKVERIDFSRRRLKERAEKYYEAGDFISALRFAHEEERLHGADGETYALLADIYENMGLHSSAVNYLFRYLDECKLEDLPDIYEGLAVNFLNLGNEAQSAFYYNKLIDSDDTISDEYKAEIAETFSSSEESGFRFVYPPQLTDYSKETRLGGLALKNGDLKGAVLALSQVEKGSKEYPSAREMQAVAFLLAGEAEKAEEICKELIDDNPNDIQALSTLSAVYVEEGRIEESRELAKKLCVMPTKTAEEKYKIATVACENDMHAEAFSLFCELEKEMPYDGNMLYFKGVSAFQSGNANAAVKTLEKLCDIYPDAVVAKYYLKQIRKYIETGKEEDEPETTYFYRLPDKERNERLKALIAFEKMPRSEAEEAAFIMERDGYFHWCFDEMDGMEQELQYLGVVTAEHGRADDFLRELLLDSEIKDGMKLEIMRLLFMRNEDNRFGVVICNIYRSIVTSKLNLGVRARGKFISAFSFLASKIGVIADEYGRKIRLETEKLYAAIKEAEAWELVAREQDIACAIYLRCGFKEFGDGLDETVESLDGKAETVEKIWRIWNEYEVNRRRKKE